MTTRFTLPLQKVTLSDLNKVGGKNASLGEMIQHLSALGINIPLGFAVTVDAYWEFLRHNNLEQSIRTTIENIDSDDLVSLRKGGMQVRQMIRNGKFPKEMEDEIIASYRQLSERYHQEATDVAV